MAHLIPIIRGAPDRHRWFKHRRAELADGPIDDTPLRSGTHGGGRSTTWHPSFDALGELSPMQYSIEEKLPSMDLKSHAMFLYNSTKALWTEIGYEQPFPPFNNVKQIIYGILSLDSPSNGDMYNLGRRVDAEGYKFQKMSIREEHDQAVPLEYKLNPDERLELQRAFGDLFVKQPTPDETYNGEFGDVPPELDADLVIHTPMFGTMLEPENP